MWYVDNQSLWLDVKILFLTVRKVLVRDGISGEGEVLCLSSPAAASYQENEIAEVLVGIYGASGFGREVLPLFGSN